MNLYRTNNKTMTQNIVISTLLLIQIACKNLGYEQQQSQAVITDTNSSCVIAMISHQGESKSDKEIQKYQKLLADDVNNLVNLEKLAWAYVNKSQVSFDPGFYKLAEQAVSCMNQQQSDSLQAMLLQGHILHNLHRFEEAEKLARQLVVLRGYWYDYGLLGDALMEQGELSEAISSYQEMMNQNPGHQVYNRAAYIRWLKGDVTGAIELLNLSVTSHAGQNNSSVAWTLTRLADYQYQSRNFDTGYKYLTMLLKQQPDYAPALLLLGRIEMAQGSFNKAKKLLTRAAQLNPLPEYRWALIEAISENDMEKQNSADLERQLYQTGETEDRRTYALYLASKGIETQKAVFLSEQELQLRHDVITLDTYAWALRSNKQLKKAGEYSRQALAEGTRSARLLYHAGVIAQENGDHQRAASFLQQAKELEHSLWPSERKHLNQFM